MTKRNPFQPNPKSVLAPKAFKELAAAGAVQAVTLRYVVSQGLIVMARVGMSERILGTYRGGPRYFQTIDAAAQLLQEHGLTQWAADTTGWVHRLHRRRKTKTD